MNKFKKVLSTISIASVMTILSLFSMNAFAGCNDVFLDGKLPVGVDYNKELCYTEYTVLYNYNYKIPMISAEHLTPDEVKASEKIGRKDAFHADTAIPGQFNQKVNDYAGTGYDKGHMTPAGDMSSTSSQFDSFSMANMTPQAKKLNEIAWRKIETEVRNEVLKNGPAFILTGSIVTTKKTLNDGIVIPDYIFKAVYFSPTDSKVFVAENNDSMNYKVLSVQDFKQQYNITLFQ